MHTLYLLSVWLHLLAAIVWIGGMFFLVLVVVPWLRGSGDRNAGVFLRETGRRFRNVGWACFAVLAATGLFNLWIRGVRPASFTDPAWLDSSFAQVVLFKLATFASVLAISAVHDFRLGPQATRAMELDPRSAESGALRRRASMLGRLNVLLALALVAGGVMLVRGTPW